jgi:hypothetical protein
VPELCVRSDGRWPLARRARLHGRDRHSLRGARNRSSSNYGAENPSASAAIRDHNRECRPRHDPGRRERIFEADPALRRHQSSGEVTSPSTVGAGPHACHTTPLDLREVQAYAPLNLREECRAQDRSAARYARFVDSLDPGARTKSRLGYLTSHTPDVSRRTQRQPRLALSSPSPSGTTQRRAVRNDAVREQPARACVHHHGRWSSPAGG